MKKKISTFFLVGLLLIVSFAAGFSVTKSQAKVNVLLGFGGQLIDSTPCTCSGGLWLLYAPIANASFPGGALSYNEYVTITYPFYNMTTPGVWHLGTYLPGVQGCWMFADVGWACFPVPVLGHEVMVGTSATPTKLAPEDISGAPGEVPNMPAGEGGTLPVGQAIV